MDPEQARYEALGKAANVIYILNLAISYYAQQPKHEDLRILENAMTEARDELERGLGYIKTEVK